MTEEGCRRRWYSALSSRCSPRRRPAQVRDSVSHRSRRDFRRGCPAGALGGLALAVPEVPAPVLSPINPSTLARYREAFKPSRAKDDPTDAELALDFLLRHPERFAPLRPQSVAMRSL